MDPKILDEMARKLADSMPGGIKIMQSDLEKNARAVLESMLSKMNLVSRVEFDIQAAVLARSRAKIDALEKQIAELERQVLK